MTRFTSILISFLFISPMAFSQTDNGKVSSSKTIKVTNQIYMYQSKGGNIGLFLGKDGIFMIDDQFADNIEDVVKDIKNLSKEPIKFLVNTHMHGDHTGGNTYLAKKGVTIFSQENVREGLIKMMRASKEEVKKDAKNKSTSKKEPAAKAPITLPQITFKEDLTFYIDREKIVVKHIHNAHTDGDAIVYFPNSNVIHTGDIFFNKRYPFIDINNGGSFEGVIEGLKAIAMMANEETKIIPGHGDLGDVQDVNESMLMLTFVYKRVMMYYRQNKSLEEIQAMNFTANYDKKFNWKFIDGKKIVAMAYNDIKQKYGPVDTRTMEQRLQDKLKEAQKKNKSKD